MRFHLSEEQTAIQDSLRRTIAAAWPDDRRRTLVDGDADFDQPSWDALMALGLGGLGIPEALGGSGRGLLDLALAAEVLGGAAAPGPIAPHLLAGLAIASCGDETLKARVLPGIVSGESVATLAIGGGAIGGGAIGGGGLEEATGGDWLPEGWHVTMDRGTISGRVPFVPGASAAVLFLVGITGGGLVLVEAGDDVHVTKLASTDRTRRVGQVEFERARATPVLEPGAPEVARVFDAGLVLRAADALGGAQHCLDRSVAYAQEREQFGRKIGAFQAVKHQLAAMALEVEPARAMLWYAAYAFDSNLPDSRRATALACAHIVDRFVSVAREAVAAHGGIGYTWDFGLHIWLRRSIFDRAYLGSPSLHRARAARLGGW